MRFIKITLSREKRSDPRRTGPAQRPPRPCISAGRTHQNTNPFIATVVATRHRIQIGRKKKDVELTQVGKVEPPMALKFRCQDNSHQNGNMKVNLGLSKSGFRSAVCACGTMHPSICTHKPGTDLGHTWCVQKARVGHNHQVSLLEQRRVWLKGRRARS